VLFEGRNRSKTVSIEARKVFKTMMGTVLRNLRGRMVAALFAATLIAPSATVCFGQDDASSLLKEGFEKFQEGDNTAARSAFEKALAADPSDDQILAFVEGVGAAEVYELLTSGDANLAGIGVEILRLRSQAAVARSDDAEATKTAVQSVMEGEDTDPVVIRNRHFYAKSIGRNLVPYLIPYLGDNELDRRAQAMTWIVLIGPDALPPLVAACKHPNGRIRTNVAALLGARSLRHPYSLGYLRAMQQTDELKEVQDEAGRAFEANIGELNGSAGPIDDAKLYFLRTANQFYLNPYRNPFDTRRYSPMVYKLDGENVVGVKVLPFQVSEEMAKQCITEALILDAEYAAARVLNLCNDAARIVEYDENAAWYATQDGHEDIKALVAQQKPYIDYVLRNRILSAPSPLLFAAIQQGALDGRSEVARTLVRAAQTIGLKGVVPSALVRALEDENSRLVRMAAAITLAYWNPADDFDAGQQVIDILANAVETSGVRTVVKGMGNERLANRFDAIFRDKLNIESLFHDSNVEELLHTLRKSPPDIVFLDEEIGYATVEQARAPINAIVTELRKDYRTVDVPVIVAVDPARVNQAKQDLESEERKVIVVAANIDHVALGETVINPLFAGKEDGKALATKLASEAARALESLASVRTELPVASATESLVRVLANRPDSVRIPCLGALGHLQVTAHVGTVAHVFEDTNNKIDVRRAAMTAVGRILAASSGAPSDVLQIILKGCQEGDAQAREASWVAFGRSGASAEAHLQLLESGAPAAGAGAGAGAGDDPAPAGDDDDDDDDLDLDLDDDDDDDLDLDLDDDDF